MRSIYWFRNDLRLYDNPLLQKAIRDSSCLLPIFVFDPKWIEPSQYDSIPQFGTKKTKFWLENVLSLKRDLIKLGSDLLVLFDNPNSALKKLNEQYLIDAIYTQELPRTYEKVQVNTLRSLGIEVKVQWQHTLLNLDDLPFEIDRLPKVFTQFRKLVEKQKWDIDFVSRPTKFPPLPHSFVDNRDGIDMIESLSDPKNSIVEAGESGASKRIETWIWEGNHLATYKETRNGMLGTNFSSHFSPWLATGAISPKTIYLEVEKYQEERVKNESTYWLIFELVWRDFFQFSMLKHGSLYFQKGGLLQLAKTSKTNSKWFDHWKVGSTGIPLVDANMRQLNHTGFMSNRGRQIVASFLINNLKIDWRLGAAYFENKLIDYDVASNWGNWAYLAGVGNDPRVRYFNILKQAKSYDPDAEFVKHWVEEIRDFEGFSAHHPWLASGSTSDDYMPIIDLESSYPR